MGCAPPRSVASTDGAGCWAGPATGCDRHHKDRPGEEEQGEGGKEAMASLNVQQKKKARTIPSSQTMD